VRHRCRAKSRFSRDVAADSTVVAVVEPVDPDLLDARAKVLAEARVEAAEAAREQAETALKRAKVILARESAELERLRQLKAREVTTTREYETAMYAEQIAATDVRSGEFALKIADFELEQAKAALIHSQPGAGGKNAPLQFEIPSPVSGVVLRVLQKSTTIVSPGTPLIEIGNLEDLECEVDVLSTDAVKIQQGQRVIIEHWGGQEPLEGRVRVREPAAFMKVSALGVEGQRVNIIIDLTTPRSERPSLGDGYRIEARIVVWERQRVLTIPAGALFRQNGRWHVYTTSNGHAVARQVTTGRSDGLRTQIVDGLKEHEPVILYPTDRVADGARVVAAENQAFGR
jgi:HlyD family secretion protein